MKVDVQILLLTLLCFVVVLVFKKTHSSNLNTSLLASNSKVCSLFFSDSDLALYIPFRIGNYESMFLLDTGYAGAPVLNARLLPHSQKNESPNVFMKQLVFKNKNLQKNVQQFLDGNRCTSYTSGCMLRLMGIGTTAEKVSDMFLCPGIELKVGGDYFQPKSETGAPIADVCMTNYEMSSPHIMTIDYLQQFSPCLIEPTKGRLSFLLGTSELVALRMQCSLFATEISGGAFVADISINNKTYKCTVDSGASTTISLSKSVSNLIGTTQGHIQQVGINGEVVCSEVVISDVKLAGHTLKHVPVFLNTTNVEETDGYIGMGLMRSFDTLLTKTAVYIKKNDCPIISLSAYQNNIREGRC